MNWIVRWKLDEDNHLVWTEEFRIMDDDMKRFYLHNQVFAFTCDLFSIMGAKVGQA